MEIPGVSGSLLRGNQHLVRPGGGPDQGIETRNVGGERVLHGDASLGSSYMRFFGKSCIFIQYSTTGEAAPCKSSNPPMSSPCATTPKRSLPRSGLQQKPGMPKLWKSSSAAPSRSQPPWTPCTAWKSRRPRWCLLGISLCSRPGERPLRQPSRRGSGTEAKEMERTLKCGWCEGGDPLRTRHADQPALELPDLDVHTTGQSRWCVPGRDRATAGGGGVCGHAGG